MDIRKKICSSCGEAKWRVKDFYASSGNVCKECRKKQVNEWYADHRQCQLGVAYSRKLDRVVVNNGVKYSYYWSEAMLKDLKRLYPRTRNADLKIIFNMGERSIVRKARELGLEKDPEWMHALQIKAARYSGMLNKIKTKKSTL